MLGKSLGAHAVMKKSWVPLFVLLLLPASYSVQRSAGRLENARTPHEDSIQSQTQEPAETILYFHDYVDGGGRSVQLALSNIEADTGAEVVVEVYDADSGPILDLFDSESAFEIPPLGSRILRSAGAGGNPARLDQSRVRSGAGQWAVDLPAGRDGSRGQRETGGVGKPVPCSWSNHRWSAPEWPSSSRTLPRTSSSVSATRTGTTR